MLKSFVKLRDRHPADLGSIGMLYYRNGKGDPPVAPVNKSVFQPSLYDDYPLTC